MFTPRIGTARPPRSRAAWMRVPSPPSTTTRSARRRASASVERATSTPLRLRGTARRSGAVSRRLGARADACGRCRMRRGTGHGWPSMRGHYISGRARWTLRSRRRGGRSPASRSPSGCARARLDDFVGQEHLLGPGTALRRAIEADQVPSLILWGPPGTGKTTLARIIAEPHGRRFVALQRGARRREGDPRDRRRRRSDRRRMHRKRTHPLRRRDPPLQQGPAGRLPAARRGRAPSRWSAPPPRTRLRGERGAPLALPGRDAARRSPRRRSARCSTARSRRREGLAGAVDARRRTRARPSRGCADGDARRALNALEVAAAAVRLPAARRIERADAEEALQQKTLLYDKAGEEHYNVISAFIKSMRGSRSRRRGLLDGAHARGRRGPALRAAPDGDLRLRGRGQRRSAGARRWRSRALQAVELVGLPEGVLPMTQAATYLALAPKSNAALTAYGAARQARAASSGPLPVPLKLRNAPTKLMKELGYGGGYKYPHNFEGHYVAEEYLPDALRGEAVVKLSESGLEKELGGALAPLGKAGMRRDAGAAARKLPGDPLPPRLRLRPGSSKKGVALAAPVRGPRRRRRARRPDARGRTDSSARRPLTMLAGAERALAAAPPPHALIGSSLGGYLAAVAASRDPRDRAARADGAGVPPLRAVGAAAPPPAELEAWRSAGLEVEHFASGRRRRIGGSSSRTPRGWPAFPDVRVPTLCIAGRRDEIVPLEDVEAFVARTPAARLVAVDDGHELDGVARRDLRGGAGVPRAGRGVAPASPYRMPMGSGAEPRPSPARRVRARARAAGSSRRTHPLTTLALSPADAGARNCGIRQPRLLDATPPGAPLLLVRVHLRHERGVRCRVAALAGRDGRDHQARRGRLRAVAHDGRRPVVAAGPVATLAIEAVFDACGAADHDSCWTRWHIRHFCGADLGVRGGAGSRGESATGGGRRRGAGAAAADRSGRGRRRRRLRAAGAGFADRAGFGAAGGAARGRASRTPRPERERPPEEPGCALGRRGGRGAARPAAAPRARAPGRRRGGGGVGRLRERASSPEQARTLSTPTVRPRRRDRGVAWPSF